MQHLPYPCYNLFNMERMNNMKKLFLAFMLILCLGLSAALADDSSEYTSGHYVYRLLEDGTAEIVSFLEDETILSDGTTVCDGIRFDEATGEFVMENEDEVFSVTLNIPDQLDGCTVTSIGKSAFSDCSMFTQVSVPQSVKEIKNRAFNSCYSLQSITLPEGLLCISEEAFDECSSLTSITLPASVTAIGAEAFYCCSDLLQINLPEGLTSIGDRAFYGCTSLTTLHLPDSIESIGAAAFADCIALEGFTLADNHPVFMLIDGVLINANAMELVCYPAGLTAAEYVIPEGITSIGEKAFSVGLMYSGTHPLSTVTLPRSMTRIGTSAFSGSSISSVVFSESITSIGDYAFFDCPKITSMVIPEGITTIDKSAFHFCSNLTSITLPQSLTSIGESVFAACSSLTEVVIPQGVTSIGTAAFQACSSLEKVTIPASVEDLGRLLFMNCPENLTVIVEPGSAAEAWCKDSGIAYIHQ